MHKQSDALLIQAAGAVLWRKSDVSQLEIAVIHRPRYDDWSLPKGKVESGESHISAAIAKSKKRQDMNQHLVRKSELLYTNLKELPKKLDIGQRLQR